MPRALVQRRRVHGSFPPSLVRAFPYGDIHAPNAVRPRARSHPPPDRLWPRAGGHARASGVAGGRRRQHLGAHHLRSARGRWGRSRRQLHDRSGGRAGTASAVRRPRGRRCDRHAGDGGATGRGIHADRPRYRRRFRPADGEQDQHGSEDVPRFDGREPGTPTGEERRLHGQHGRHRHVQRTRRRWGGRARRTRRTTTSARARSRATPDRPTWHHKPSSSSRARS